MLFAVVCRYSSDNVNAIVSRFASVVGDDEFPAGVRLVNRYHSPATKWGCVIVEVDDVVPLHLWLSEWIDVADIEVHPVTTDETVAPVVEAMLSNQ